MEKGMPRTEAGLTGNGEGEARRENRKGLLLTALCAVLISGTLFGVFMLRDRGFLTIIADFNHQQIPFSAAALDGIRSGRTWIWGMDLGSSLVTAFSFYNLGSPFFWLTIPFPKELFPYFTGFLYILKYTAAAAGAYLYLRRFSGLKGSVSGALVYAFSGFQATNLMFFHFHDVVAFFPLLLLGMEKLLQEKKEAPLILAVFLNCLVNYFFFVQELVFLILYYLFRVWKRGTCKEALKGAGSCLLCGILGVGMAGVLFVPSAMFVLEGDRSAAGLNLSAFYGLKDLLHILKGFLFPGDTMDRLTAFMPGNWKSTCCYLPLFGTAFALAYTVKKRDWLGKLLLFLCLLAFFPWGNGLFILFTDVYQRWWYMLTLMLALATARVLDAPEDYPVRKALAGTLIITGLFCLMTSFLPQSAEEGPLVLDGRRYLILFLLSAGGLGFLTVFGKRVRFRVVLAAVCTACLATTGFTLYSYRTHESEAAEIKTGFRLGLQLVLPDDQYRFNTSENLLTMPNQAGGYGGFTSTAENESYRMVKMLDIYHVPSSTGEDVRGLIPYLPQLLGAKYEIGTDESAAEIRYSVEADGKSFYISEGKACPIGFALDRYLAQEDISLIPQEKKAIALMNAFAAEGELLDAAGKAGLSQLNPAEASALQAEESMERTVEEAVSGFARSGTGFSCETCWDRDRFVYFSVPFDRGWAVEIDGAEQKIYRSGGMMVLDVPSGNHRIVFTYHTPGFRAGALLTLISWGIFLTDLGIERRRKRTDRY